METPGEKLKDRFGAAHIVTVMKEDSVDMSDNVRMQLTEDMLEDFDKVVVMAEPETVPDWLAQHANTVVWTIPDAKNKSLDDTRTITNAIKVKVTELTEENRTA